MPGGSGTALSGYANTVLAGGRTPIIVERVTNGTDLFPGAVAAADGETFPDVAGAIGDDADSNAADGSLVGVCLEVDGLDIDTDFVDGQAIRIVTLGSGTIVLVALKTSAGAVEAGMKIVLADQLAGHCGIRSESNPPTVEENALNEKTYVGRAMEASADVAAVRWIRVLLS